MKTITIIIGIILSLTLVSAITIYAGECKSIEFPNSDPVNWSVEGNSSDMEGFSFTKNGTEITYCFHKLYKPDTFTLTFYNYQEVEINDSPSSGRSRGTSCIYDENYDWNCSEWTECIDKQQTRTCKKYNNCRTTFGKPDEIRDCSTTDDVAAITDSIDEPDEPKKSNLKNIIYIFCVILIIITIILIIRNKKKTEQKFKTINLYNLIT